MKGQRIQLVQFQVTKEGTVELPDGATVVALEFQDDGGLGSDRRPATAWVAVPVGAEPH